jgi:hypothetical protein
LAEAEEEQPFTSVVIRVTVNSTVSE